MNSNMFPLSEQELEDNHISVVTCTDWNLSLKLQHRQESGSMQVFQLLPELAVCFNCFQSRSCPKFGLEPEHRNKVIINYCFSGRCEVELENEMFLFLEPQDLVISNQWTKKDFTFPIREYKGIQLFIDLEAISTTSKIFWGQIGFDLRKLEDMFCKDTGYYIIHDNGQLKQLLQEIERISFYAEKPLLLIKTMEFLFELYKGTFTWENVQKKYYSKSQVQIAQEVESLITHRLDQHFKTEDLAGKYGISPTSLQNYFKGIYGEPISIYLRKARMNTAAKLLKHSRKKVADIAAQVGYENQSKFAAAFKDVWSCNPLDYRKLFFEGDDFNEEFD